MHPPLHIPRRRLRGFDQKQRNVTAKRLRQELNHVGKASSRCCDRLFGIADRKNCRDFGLGQVLVHEEEGMRALLRIPPQDLLAAIPNSTLSPLRRMRISASAAS